MPGCSSTTDNGKAPLIPISSAAERTYDPSESKWQPPDTGWIKVNVDAGWDAATSSGGIGMIARDDSGAVIQAE